MRGVRNEMTEISFAIFIEFLYSKFLLSFIICFFGALIAQIVETVKKSNKIRLTKVFSSSIVGALVVCVIIDYKELSIALYTFLCFFLGLWGSDILKVLLNQSYIIQFIQNFLSNAVSPAGKAFSKTLEDVKQKEKVEKDTDKDKE